MFNQDDFEAWICSSHKIMNLFEGRYDVYPICGRWIEEWFDMGKFSVNSDNFSVLKGILETFEVDAYRNMKDNIENKDVNWNKIKNAAKAKFNNLFNNHLNIGEKDNIGFGLSPFLFTWNFQRFKSYLIAYIIKKKLDFNENTYFINLHKLAEELKNELKYFRNKKLYLDEIERDKVNDLISKVNCRLKEIGIGNNEPVGSAKFLHIFAPYYFPLIDNSIAYATGLIGKEKGWLTIDKYSIWIEHIHNCINQHDIDKIRELENKFNLSILKLIDEGFFLMSSIKLSLRVKEIGFNLND